MPIIPFCNRTAVRGLNVFCPACPLVHDRTASAVATGADARAVRVFGMVANAWGRRMMVMDLSYGDILLVVVVFTIGVASEAHFVGCLDGGACSGGVVWHL